MALSSFWLLYCISSYLVWPTNGHVRFVCPRPASPKSDIAFTNQSIDYCGLNMDSVFDTNHMEVEPGLFTLRFEETHLQRNSPFRVTLHQIGANDSCLLLDHIPHNNHASISSACSKKHSEYPLGICESSTYYITVKIPDVRCDRCYLRLAFIHLDHTAGETCNVGAGTCEGYVSCAAIKIRASPSGKEGNISACGHYEDNLPGDWPFRPMDIYSVELHVGLGKVDPLLVFDPLHNELHIDIPRHALVHEIEEVQLVLNTTVIWNITVHEEHRLLDTVSVVWNVEDEAYIIHLEDGDLSLNVKSTEESFAGNISFSTQHNVVGNFLAAEVAEYTTDGWLADERFRGLHAENTDVITPSGPCTPTPRNFIAFLHSLQGYNFSHGQHGVLAASFLGDYVAITVALFGLDDQVTDITIIGSHLLGAPDLKLPLSKMKNNILQVSLDASKHIAFIDTVRFLKTVRVDTSNPRLGLTGDFQEGMFSLIRDGDEVIGVGGFQFTKGQWLKYEVLLTNLNVPVREVVLTDGRDLVYNLSEHMWHLDEEFCLVEGLVQSLDSQFLLSLWRGNLHFTATTDAHSLQGKITAAGESYCKELNEGTCFVFDLTPNGRPVSIFQESVPPHGKAAFVLDRAGVLLYSIEVHNLEDQKYEAEVRGQEGLVFNSDLVQDPLQYRTFVANGRMPVSPNLYEKLLTGELALVVTKLVPGPPVVSGMIPPLTKHVCAQQMDHVVGENDGLWSSEAAPFKEIFALNGDRLVFIYKDNVTVFSMASKDDYKTCNFDNATLFKPVTEDLKTREKHVVVQLNTPGMQYFAAVQYCNDTPPLKIAVSVTVPSGSPGRDRKTDMCGALVFSDWRQNYLDSYTGPQPASPAVIGLAVGTALATLFFTLDRSLRQRGQTTLPGSRFQRF
ncbi:uncharacterized protein LOC112569939 [Pomacea canaliculata]|uniref:uncharacterized protein LOC112569939 n=1 Tax=Pomacea canaliculata TaxID=400727 RepID=UPI000D73F283|nr:uncharacterized protein LOC112569939 [Pomacea canaliculata]